MSRGKGKAAPLQVWCDPEGSGNLRFPDVMTTAQDGGKVISLMHRPPLTPGRVKQSRYRPGVAQRVPGSEEVKVPRFHDNGTGWW
jgi:hypothetical protein